MFLSSLNIVCLCELTVSACAMCLSSDYLCMQPTAATLNEWGIRKKEGRFWTSETNICVMILISFLHFQFQFHGIAPLFSIIIIYLSKIKLVHTKYPPNPTQTLSFNSKIPLWNVAALHHLCLSPHHSSTSREIQGNSILFQLKCIFAQSKAICIPRNQSVSTSGGMLSSDCW